MSSLLSKVEELRGERGQKALNKALDEAERLAGEGTAGKAARDAIKAIRPYVPQLAHLTGGALVSLIVKLDLGDTKGAKTLFVNPHMGLAELRRISKLSTRATYLDTQEREAAWDAVKDMLLDLGRAAVKALPLLMASL